MAIMTLPAEYQDDWDAFCEACQQAGIPRFALTLDVPPADLSALWSVDEAERLGAVPAGLEDNQLTVAMLNPRDQQVLAVLESRTGYRIFPVLADSTEVSAAISRMNDLASAF